MKKLLAAFAGITLLAGSASAFAADGKSELNITAKVHSSCNLKFETSSVSFDIGKDSWQGAVQPGKFSIACGGGDVSVALDGGSSQNVTARQMVKAGGATPIGYTVYKGNQGQDIWGDGSAGGSASPYAIPDAKGGTYDFRVEVPAGSISGGTEDGDYADKLIATVLHNAAS